MPTAEPARSLAELVSEQAVERPDAVAIEDGPRRLTYAELDQAAGGVAAGLIASGAVDEEAVGVCLPRSWQAVVAFLGTLRAGAAYLPLDPDHPPERRRALLEIAGARRVLTGSGHDAGLPEAVERLDVEALARKGGESTPCAPGGDRLAYVLFTSGSTGRPKGVEVTHRNITHFVRMESDLIARRDDVALHVVPLGFDISGHEIWGALANGARLVVAPPGRPDPVELGRLIAARGVTILTISAGLLHELVHAALPDLGGLRLLTGGGDVLSPTAAGEMRRAHPGVRLLNSYGPTEATIAATSFDVVEADGGPVPIGRALPGYRLRVLDEEGEPVPADAPGELWIGGAGVARGYRNDAERTAAAFLPDPDGGRMYRTGDRVRLRADGELLFLGRLDDQVKISSQRVEPGEVEHVLADHAGLRAAAVVAREDVPGHKHLVGYAVPSPGATPQPQELRDHVAERLPAFMVPSTIVLLDALPLNERGKVDRSALPAPSPRQPGAATGSEEPIAELMAEVLQLDSIGPGESFFELGGSSLLAIRLVGRLREQLDLTADIGAVFEAPTPSALTELLAGRGEPAPALPPLRPGPSRATAPLSAAQRRAWLFCHMNPDSIAYQFAVIFQLEGELDRDALEGALADLLRRHEIFRTSFEERDGEPVQVIHDQRQPRLDVLDLRGKAGDAWPRLARERVRTPIDPGDAPLVRWVLVRLGEDRWSLIHTEHHLIHDGWSFALLAGELAELYSARVEERAPDLAPAVQFQDYARWERLALDRPTVRRQIDHWARALDPDPPLLQLPGARPRPARETFAGGSVRRRLGADLAARLRALAHENGATLFMVTLAAFLTQLRRYSGRDDLQIGSGLANRRDPNSERTIGMTVNTIGLRCDLGGDPDVRELLARVRRTALDAYANADAPFDAVVRAAGARRNPTRSPLVQVLFSFHDAPRADERWQGLDVRLVQGIPNGTAKADLNVIGVAERDGGMTFLWEHSELLPDAAADRLAGHHLCLLEQFAARPDARLSELDLLGEEERAELREWNAPAGSYDRAATLPGLVAAQAGRTPQATAILDGARRLTYAELLDRARRVAAALRERGVAAGDRVGVLLGRSADSVVAQLGVLSAGAAYVPLDAQHPPARLSRALTDAGVGVVLTDTELRRRLPVGLAALEVEAASASAPGELVETAPTDLAYVIYTSGSTGEPKGVEVTHRNVVRLVDDPGYAELGPGTVMLHAASPAFDAATLEVWGPLANGGIVACLGEHPTPDEVAAAIERDGVTTLWLTAGLFHQLVDRRPECLAGVRQVLAGGDVLSPDHVRRALAALPPGGRLTNGYGPTEGTTFATTFDLRPGDPVEGPIPIGRPIQGTTCHVLDRDGNELPVGVEGELAIGGDGVARGYRNDPELTAARFREDPDRAGARLYLSGDLVRRRPDGALEFLGRADRQLKLRGVRVEPAEVESALRDHAAVADAAVAPFERAPGDVALAAYVVSRPGGGPDPADLRTHAASRLPAAMVPAAWISLPELPLSRNGKLDAERLPTPGSEHLLRRDGHVRPPSAGERRVIRCFEEVLGVDSIGAEDDFFALGGHSLLALSLFAELERIGGRRLPLATIFEAPTPRALAACLGSDAPASRWDNLVALKPQGSRPPLFVVTAGDGNVVGFGALARRMSAEQPLYGLQPSGLDGRRPLDRGVEEMARTYLTALRQVQPNGPYLLAGRCNGATVAFEMAQQLRAAGEEVALLAALDSGPPAPKPLELAPGIPYDPLMETAWLRARDAGEEVPDLSEPDGAARLVAWLRTPVGPDVSRYMHELWSWRSDLQRAWPDPLGTDAAELAAFAWNRAREELVEAMLPPAAVEGCRSPEGHPWDWAMAAAWRQLGESPPAPFSRAGWREVRAHLTEQVGADGLNRYLLGAWSRPDLQDAFREPLGADAAALREWAWTHGVEEGLAPDLLPAPPWPLPRRARLEPALRPARAGATRLRGQAARVARHWAAEARLRAIEELERQLDRPLPGAGERAIHRALRTAREARDRYRADPWPGRVVLIVSREFEDKPSYLGWRARALGGAERHGLPCGHVEMLREPGAGLLADRLESCIEEALARPASPAAAVESPRG